MHWHNPLRRQAKDLARPQGAATWALYLGGLLVLAGLFTLALNRFLWQVPAAGPLVPLWLGSTLVMAVLFAVSGMFVFIGYPMISIVALVALLEWYVVSIGIGNPKVLITDLMETDLRELLGFVDWHHVVVVLLTVLAVVALVNLLWRLTPNALVGGWKNLGFRGRLALALGGVAIFATGAFMEKPPIEEPQERVLQAALWPVASNLQTLRVMKGYYFGEQQFATRLAELPSATLTPSTLAATPGGITVVFVFGESLRGDHWGLNGYARNTTPRLALEPGVVNFPDTLSFGTYTQVSSINMLTSATFANPNPTSGPFVDLFVHHGFKSASFISARPTSVQRKFISSIKQQVAIRGLAEKLLPDIRAFAAEPGAANKFMFIYTEGNHFPYKRGYSEKFSKFKPDEHGLTNLGADAERLVNAYDNAVLYTDDFLVSVMDTLRDRPAVLVYAADHGDALGDSGNFLRGGSMTSAYLRKIPMFIWVSPPFEAAFPDKVRQLRANAALRTSHDNIFPTILSLSGISTSLIDPTLDLTDARALTRTFQVSDGAPAGSKFHDGTRH